MKSIKIVIDNKEKILSVPALIRLYKLMLEVYPDVKSTCNALDGIESCPKCRVIEALGKIEISDI